MSFNQITRDVSTAKQVFSFGEILWDQFPSYRIAGGSPFNVAAHLHFLGYDSHLISALGNDEAGRDLLDLVHGMGLSSTYVCQNELPSGLVNIRFSEGEPAYTIEEDVAWDYIGIQDVLIGKISSANAFVFASLAQRSEMNVQTLKKLMDHLPAQATVIFDCNLRPPFIDDEKLKLSIEWSDIVKCNEGEWEFIQELFDLDALELVEEAQLEALLITKGEKGATVFTCDGLEIHQSAMAIPKTNQKGDFVGVGDAFLAAVTALYLQNTEWSEILERAAHYAAWVASQRGGTPHPPEDVIRAVQAIK